MPRPQKTKTAILNAARDLCLAEGLSAVTMRAIAGEVGISATAIYRHYRDREAIINELIGHANREFSKYLVGPDSGWDRFVSIAHGYLRFYLEEPRLYELLFVTQNRPDVGSLPERVESPNFAYFVDAIAENMTSGLLRPDDPVEVAITCWAYFHGLTQLHRTGRFESSPRDLNDLFNRGLLLLLSGLASPEGLDRWSSQ